MISAGCWSVFFLLPWCTFALLAKWLYIWLMKQNDCKIPGSSKQASNHHAGVWSRKRCAFGTMSRSHSKEAELLLLLVVQLFTGKVDVFFDFPPSEWRIPDEKTPMRCSPRFQQLFSFSLSGSPPLLSSSLSPSFPLVFSSLLSVYQAGLTRLVCCR